MIRRLSVKQKQKHPIYSESCEYGSYKKEERRTDVLTGDNITHYSSNTSCAPKTFYWGVGVSELEAIYIYIYI